MSHIKASGGRFERRFSQEQGQRKAAKGLRSSGSWWLTRALLLLPELTDCLHRLLVEPVHLLIIFSRWLAD